MKKRNLLASGIAVLLAVTMVLGGGTFAYLSGTTGQVENTFTQNHNGVELNESTGNDYNIVPGTSQEKDPTVTATYTLDSYVFVEVTDTTNGLVEWKIDSASGWILLDKIDNGDSITYIYYQLLKSNGGVAAEISWSDISGSNDKIYEVGNEAYYWDTTTNTITYYSEYGATTGTDVTALFDLTTGNMTTSTTTTLQVLKDNIVSYSSALTNDDMTADETVSLTFQAYIIQAQLDGTTSEEYADPTTAYYVVKTGSSYYDENATYVAVEADGDTTLSQALASAISAASSEETTVIVLPEADDDTEAVSLSSFVSVSGGKDIVIDLNGNTLSGGSRSRSVQVTDGAELTLVDGEIKNENGYGVMAFEGSTVTLDDVEVTASSYAVVATESTIIAEGATITSSEGAAVLTQSGNNTLTLTDCTIISENYLGIFDQGANNVITVEGCTITSAYFGVYHNGSTSPVTITLKDSTITDTAGTGVYISNASTAGREKQTLVIDNCTITGPTAVEFKHTNATITNSTLIATATPTASFEFGNGTCSSGYSLACTTNSANDKVTGNVVVSGSTFRVKNGETSSEGYVFVFTVAEDSSVTINGEAVSNYNTYGGESNESGISTASLDEDEGMAEVTASVSIAD